MRGASVKFFIRCAVISTLLFFSSACIGFGTDYYACGNYRFIGVNWLGCITEGAIDYCPGNSGTPWVRRILVDAERARLETVQKVVRPDQNGQYVTQEYLRIWELELKTGRLSRAKEPLPVTDPDAVPLRYQETCRPASAWDYYSTLFRAMLVE